MFDKIFKSKESKKSENPKVEISLPKQDENIKADEAVLNLLLQEYTARFKDGKGVHIETMLCILGALSGFGCQMGIREALIRTNKAKENELLIEVKTSDGQKFYYGDFLNEPIFSTKQGRISVWSLVGGAAQAEGAKELPDINEIAKYYVDKLGSKEFYVPNLPEEHFPRILPFEALGYWSTTRTLQILYKVDPLHWGWTYALAAHKLIRQTKGILDSALAAKIVMEAAIPMSKIDPERVEGAYFNKK